MTDQPTTPQPAPLTPEEHAKQRQIEDERGKENAIRLAATLNLLRAARCLVDYHGTGTVTLTVEDAAQLLGLLDGQSARITDLIHHQDAWRKKRSDMRKWAHQAEELVRHGAKLCGDIVEEADGYA